MANTNRGDALIVPGANFFIRAEGIESKLGEGSTDSALEACDWPVGRLLADSL